jgi:cytochrome P450
VQKLIIAGTDTTAHALSSLIFHLLNNPETMKKLTYEIRSSFADISEIHMGPALTKCRYLSACIDESLRLSPSVGGCLMREVLPGGITIHGEQIPPGVDCGVPYHVIMQSIDYYDAPLEYRPERWMASETPKEQIQQARAAWIPFGMGSTSCVGRAWAVIEMQLTVARLLYRFDVSMDTPETAQPSPASERFKTREKREIDMFVMATSGPFLKFRLATTSREKS